MAAGPPSPKISRSLLRVELSPRIQIVKVQDRIEHERIRPDRLPAIDRIDREQHHVPLFHRRVHHRRPLRDIASAAQQTGNQQVVLRRAAQRDARTLGTAE